MLKKRYLDEFTDNISEADFVIGAEMKKAILEKTCKKIRINKWFNFKSIAAACILLIALSAFIPNTPVNALCKKIFSFIPGIGIVQNSDGTNQIEAVLNEPIKVINDGEFVEIKTAYIMKNTLQISIKTNVGAVNVGDFDDPAKFKEFFAGETAPNLYLVRSKGKIKPNHSVWSGPSYETRVYSIKASFVLEEENINTQTFKFEMEDFDQVIEILMSPVNSDTSPESMGNVAVIDNIMVFANVSRENGILEVLLSSVAPNEYKDIRFHLFDNEAQLFESGVKVIDGEGITYTPDEDLQEKNNGGIDSLYFNIPDDVDDLKLIVPQILYNKKNSEEKVKIFISKFGEAKNINRELTLPGSKVTLDSVTLIHANDPILPEDFREYNCLRIDATAVMGENKREMVLRVLPRVEASEGSFGYKSVSQSTYAEIWDSSQKGYSITTFDELDSTKKVLLNFDVEYAMIGPWEINLK